MTRRSAADRVPCSRRKLRRQARHRASSSRRLRSPVGLLDQSSGAISTHDEARFVGGGGGTTTGSVSPVGHRSARTSKRTAGEVPASTRTTTNPVSSNTATSPAAAVPASPATTVRRKILRSARIPSPTQAAVAMCRRTRRCSRSRSPGLANPTRRRSTGARRWWPVKRTTTRPRHDARRGAGPGRAERQAPRTRTAPARWRRARPRNRE